MHRVVLNMQMSSDEAFSTVSLALGALPDVTTDAPSWNSNRHLIVTIESDDPDVVDIVREVTWQFDALAIQHSLHLADAG